MPKNRPKSKASEAEPVMELRVDASNPDCPACSEPGAAPAHFSTPCSLTGLGAGISGGALGWVFGFGGYWIRNLRGGQLKASLAEGWGSAKTFGIMGGLYAAVSCFMQRLRQKNDAWNGAASGCATGLALGWKQGPINALQSCAMLGFFSYFVDSMGVQPAEAAAGSSGGGRQQQQQQARQRSPVELLLSLAVPLLFGPCAGGDCVSEDGGGSGVLGCRVRH
ncbi:hypothetical protein ABPG75_001538 [Micractinium tetrahymenae]